MRRERGEPAIKPPGVTPATPPPAPGEAPDEPEEAPEGVPEAPEPPETPEEGPRRAVGRIVPKPPLSREPQAPVNPTIPGLKRTRGGERTSAQRRGINIGSFEEPEGAPKIDDVKPEPLADNPEDIIQPSENGDLEPETDPTSVVKTKKGVEAIKNRKLEMKPGKPGLISQKEQKPDAKLTSPQRRGFFGALRRLGSKVASLFRPSKK